MPGALRHREYRLFWASSIVGGIGMWLQLLAVGWLVVELAKRDGSAQLSSFYLGLLGLASAIPTLVVMPLAGGVIDRSDQRTLLLASQVAAMTLSIVLATATTLGFASLPLVIAVTALLAAARAFDLPTRWTVTGRIVPQKDFMSALGMQSVSFNLPQVIGPAIGGLLIGPLGIHGLLWIATASFTVVVAALIAMRPLPPSGGAGTESSIMRSVAEGVAYVARDRVLLPAVVICIVVAFLVRPYGMLLPAFAASVLTVGATELSWLYSASGIGGVVGALAVASLGRLRQRGLVFVGCCAVSGLTLAVAAVQSSIIASVIATAAFGIATMIFSGISNAVFQVASPPAFRGRVLGLYTTLFVGFIPLGTMAIGTAGAIAGLTPTLLVAGSLALLVGLVALIALPRLRGLELTPDHGTTAPSAESHSQNAAGPAAATARPSRPAQ